MSKIYSLQCNYSQENGNYLIISKKTGFNSADFNNIQVKMLLSNQIPQLLPIEIEETDFTVNIRYDTTFKLMLSSYINIQQFDFNQRIEIFLRIISIIDDSKLYMLNEDNYLVNCDFIFISKDYSQIYLTYLPLNSIEMNVKVQIEIKKLFNNLFYENNDINNEIYTKLEKFFDCEYFTINDLKKFLLILMDGKKIGWESSISSNDRLIERNIQNKNNKPKQSLKSLSERQKIFLYLGTIFLIALVWKGYELIYTESMFYICIGLTIGLLDIVYILIKLWRPKFKREKMSRKNIIKEECCSTKEVRSNNDKILDLSEHKEINNFTTSLENSEETTLLKNQKQNAYLMIDRGTNTEKILISRKNFIIGRNPTVVDYIEKTRGISRVHVEIVEISSGYEIRDLESRNGTFLNNELLIPNKLYPITDGDILKIAMNEYVFRKDTSIGG